MPTTSPLPFAPSKRSSEKAWVVAQHTPIMGPMRSLTQTGPTSKQSAPDPITDRDLPTDPPTAKADWPAVVTTQTSIMGPLLHALAAHSPAVAWVVAIQHTRNMRSKTRRSPPQLPGLRAPSPFNRKEAGRLGTAPAYNDHLSVSPRGSETLASTALDMEPEATAGGEMSAPDARMRRL